MTFAIADKALITHYHNAYYAAVAKDTGAIVLSGADSSGNTFDLQSSGTGFFVKPIRQADGVATLGYNPTTGEITQSANLTVSGTAEIDGAVTIIEDLTVGGDVVVTRNFVANEQVTIPRKF